MALVPVGDMLAGGCCAQGIGFVTKTEQPKSSGNVSMRVFGKCFGRVGDREIQKPVRRSGAFRAVASCTRWLGVAQASRSEKRSKDYGGTRVMFTAGKK